MSDLNIFSPKYSYIALPAGCFIKYWPPWWPGHENCKFPLLEYLLKTSKNGGSISSSYLSAASFNSLLNSSSFISLIFIILFTLSLISSLIFSVSFNTNIDTPNLVLYMSFIPSISLSLTTATATSV